MDCRLFTTTEESGALVSSGSSGPSVNRICPPLATAVSTELRDAAWDSFLETVPQGQFQQSSLWAQSKAVEGWKPIRAVVRDGGQIVGGFQILHRSSRFGEIGYISKGPVARFPDPGLSDFLISEVTRIAKANRLAALILQPPDTSEITGSALAARHFLPNHVQNVIAGTLIIDVSNRVEEMKRQMRRTTLLEVKRASARGITIREGERSELGTFFNLMKVTCERQGTSPSPASEAAFCRIWDAFHPEGKIRLAFAEYEGRAVAGTVCLCFGDRVSFWKKGWSGEQAERKPNSLAMFDAMCWAHENGYKSFDCVGFDPGMARSLLQGEPITEPQKHSRYFFLLGFGGYPVLLPESMIYMPNPVARWMYQALVAIPVGRRLVQRLARTE